MQHVETAKIHDLLSGDVDYRGGEILVDRMWPRGVKKDSVELKDWLPEVAPSPDLRKWFDHDADKFEEFAQRYRRELDENQSEDLEKLLSADNPVLVFAAHDRQINHATVLAEWLEEQK